MIAVCAVPDCVRPGVVTVSVSSVRISFRTDNAQRPQWAAYLRCWVCAEAELGALIANTTPLTSDLPA